MKRQTRISDVLDIFVYHNGKNYIYSPPFSKRGYILTDKEAKEFSIYSTRLFAPISLGILVYYFLQNALYALIATIILFVIMETTFYKKLLAKLPTIDNLDKKSCSTVFDLVLTKVDAKQLFVPLILCVALTVLIPINAIYNLSGYIVIVNCICAGITALISIFFLICIIKSQKKK